MPETASLELSDNSQHESPLPEPSQDAQDTPQNQLPPEARGETNGGPLGCCFGVSMGLLTSAGIVSLSIPLLSHITAGLNGFLAFLVIVVAIIFVIIATLALGYVGWKIGRRVFREYEPDPRQQRKMARLQQRQLEYAQRKRAVKSR